MIPYARRQERNYVEKVDPVVDCDVLPTIQELSKIYRTMRLQHIACIFKMELWSFSLFYKKPETTSCHYVFLMLCVIKFNVLWFLKLHIYTKLINKQNYYWGFRV